MADAWLAVACRNWCRLLALMAMVAVVAVACGSSDAGGPAVRDLRGPLQEMLKQRALALQRGDVEGYLRPLSPRARAVEEPIARGAASVALASVELFLGEAEFDPATAAAKGVEVDFIYQYKGIPADNPFRFRLVYDLERKDGSWAVSSAQPARELPPPPWATGPVETARSLHFLVLFRPGLGAVDTMLSLLEQSRAELAPKLTLEADPRHVVLLARDDAEFNGMLGRPVPSAVVALAAAEYRGTAGHPPRPESRHMAVNLETLLGQPGRKVPYQHADEASIPAGQVFQHELAHLALTRFTRPTTPSWVVEGAAVYLSGEQRPELRLGQERGLFDQMSFSLLGRQESLQNGLEYAYASSAVRYLVEEFGARTFWEFYRNFKDMRSTGNLPEDLAQGTHRLLRRFFTIDERELDRRTKEWISKNTA